MDFRITKFPELSAESIKAISDWIQKNYEEREQASDDTNTYGPQALFGNTSAVYLYSKALATIDRLDRALNLLLTSETIFTLGSINYRMSYNQYIAEIPNLKSFKKTGLGTSSNDTLSLDSKWANYTISLLAGDDTVSVSDGGHRVFANLGSGNDFFQGNSGSDGVFGDIGDDKILGGDGFDGLDGGGGNDVISGQLGIDLIYGGLGDDILSGGAGDDFIDGGEGNDTATYQGNFDNYQITFDNYLLKIIDLTSDRDGSDTLTRIEYIKFSDITKTVIQLPGAPPTYTISPSTTAINEGATLTTSVATNNVASGTTLYFSLSGTGITAADLSAGSLIGDGITDSTGKFSFSHTFANDLTTDGAETLSIKLYSDSARTLQVGSTVTVNVVDSSITPAPTYTLTPSAISINEGEILTNTINTSNVATETKLYYALSGTGITAADFSSGALTGLGTIASNGTFSFSHTFANDLTTEGAETLNIKLFTDSARTVQVGSTANVSISDTSVTPAPTYTLTPSTATINEGAVLTSTVAIANVAAGTKFYYALSGTGITTTDFSAGALTGEGTTDATGKFTFTHTLANDLITEGSETLNIKLFSDSSRTIQVGNIASVSIDDTSGTPTPVINKTTSIHRFFNSKSGVHLYSPSNEEKDTIINNPAWGYKYEGVAYQAPLTGGTELYRFYNADKNYHFNTASTGEALSIIQNALGANYDLITGINQNPISGSWGFKYEGRSFRVSEPKTEHNSTPVYRFFHAQKSVHFYSSSLIEVNNVIGMSNGEQYKDNFLAAAGAPLLNGGWGYKFEGVAWFI